MKTLIGKRATGTRKDTSYRRNYYKDFPRGWETQGTISKYDKKTRKYLIEGTNYIFNETGTYKVSEGGDWFYRTQIETEEEDQ